MARVTHTILGFLIIFTCLVHVQPANAQDTNSLVMKVFQEFSQVNKWPWPAIKMDDYDAARNNNSEELPALLKKSLTAVKGQPASTTSSGKIYEGTFVYYTPGGECFRVADSQGEAIVYGGYIISANVSEYNTNEAASAAVANNLAALNQRKGNDSFQSKAISVRQSRGYEFDWLRVRELGGSDNKKASERQQGRFWSQGKYYVFLSGTNLGCPSKATDPFSLSDQLYDLVSKHLAGSPAVPPPPLPTADRAVKGRVTDGFEHGLPNLFVRLAYGTNEEVTRTDGNGYYSFTNLPCVAVAGYIPQKDSVHIEIMLQYLDKPPVKQRAYESIFQFFNQRVDAETFIKITSADITLAANNGPTTFNISLGDSQIVRSATLPTSKLKVAALVYFHLSQAVSLAVKLGPPLSMLPIDVVVDNPNPPDDPHAQAWWNGSRGTLSKPRSSINLTTRLMNETAAEIAYVVWHEFGHHFMADTYGDVLPVSGGRKAHGGYCFNTSSNDSWIEGWAIFFAALVNKEVNLAADYWLINRSYKVDLESNLKPWHNERLAVAGVLMDLIDSAAIYPKGTDDEPVTASVTELWKVITNGTSTQPGSNNHIFDVVDLYTNLKNLKVGTDSSLIRQEDLDAVFKLHGFYEVNNPNVNSDFIQGAKISWTSHGRFPDKVDSQGVQIWCEEMKPRRTDPPMQGAYVLVNPGSTSIDTIYRVEITYAAPNSARNYSYDLPGSEVKDGRIYLLLPPPEEPATVRIIAKGQPASEKPLEVTSAEFWSKVPSASDQPLKNHTFSIKAQPAGWVLPFAISGVLLALVILGIGFSQFHRSPYKRSHARKGAARNQSPAAFPPPPPQQAHYRPVSPHQPLQHPPGWVLPPTPPQSNQAAPPPRWIPPAG